jgi:hypothetical protein
MDLAPAENGLIETWNVMPRDRIQLALVLEDDPAKISNDAPTRHRLWSRE